MAEKIKRLGIARDSDYMLYVKDGAVWQVRRKGKGEPKGKPERLTDARLFEMDHRYIYFVDRDGDVSRARRVEDGNEVAGTETPAVPAEPVDTGRMRIRVGDSVAVDGDCKRIGIVESRSGELLRVRVRDSGDFERQQVERARVKAVADCVADTFADGSKALGGVTLTGGSSLAELVSLFGYAADSRLRADTLLRVEKQLRRAGLNVTYDDEPTRDQPFRLVLVESDENDSGSNQAEHEPAELPAKSWPEALGLDGADDLTFLRSLAEPEPVLCLLALPSSGTVPPWLTRTWEGMISHAYLNAQRFVRREVLDNHAEVLFGSPALLAQYEKPSALEAEMRLKDSPRALNLVVLDRDSRDSDLTRLKAKWPGPVFHFHPDWAGQSSADTCEEKQALVDILCLLGGQPGAIRAEELRDASPLALLVWARDASRSLLSAASASVSGLVRRGKVSRFRGSNEMGTALALKALAGEWARQQKAGATLKFEDCTDDEEEAQRCRTDLVAKGVGAFEIETMVGSGPIESFCARKVFARTDNRAERFFLVVPTHALLWAGPYLADVAQTLGDQGHVMFPGFARGDTSKTTLIPLRGRTLTVDLEVDRPSEGSKAVAPTAKAIAERPITLKDIAGYQHVHKEIQDEVLWARRNPHLVRSCSRAAGILFYGPPGCGKSRLARAICGELEQEVRLIGPSDMRGIYLGWGQHMIREHFDWLFDEGNRVLLIDEFDAVARSRAGEMHSDEKADVNELLVQLDKATRRGSMVICTTNYLSSLDEAVLRSGRFAHFIAVPPPDQEAAVAIVNYYLRQLSLDGAGARNERVQVDVPGEEEVSRVVADLWTRMGSSQGRMCGADLEAAVNAAYRGAAREAAKTALAERTHVMLDIARLQNALASARRSISVESMQHFLDEIKRNSSDSVFEAYRASMGA